MVDFCLYPVIHILKAYASAVNLGYLENILVHPMRRQNFAGKLQSTLRNIWDLVVYKHVRYMCVCEHVCMWACVLLYMCVYEHVRFMCIWGCTLHVYLWACALHVCIQACTLTGASREPAPSVWHGAVQCSRIVWTWTAPIVWHGTVQLSVWTAPIGAI